MKILVTGTAGFIGMHVALALLDEGHDVVGIDNFNDYYSVALKRARHAELEKRTGYTGLTMDLADTAAIQALFAAHRFDRVCHLAAQAGVRYSLENPVAYERSNLLGFLSILEACRHSPGHPRLVYASSSSVYGGNRDLPFSETQPVDNPVSLYAATKKANELMAHCYTHLYGIQTIGLRFFTVYGPWGRPDMAMWLFTEAMLAGRPIKVFNHGDMQRDFTYVDDIVKGVKGALFAEGLPAYDIFNLGNHRSENLMYLIGLIGSTLGVEPQMQMLPMQPGDVPATYADIEHARTALGFEPTTTLQTGVPNFIRWYKEYHAR